MSNSAAVGIDVGGTKTLCVLVDKDCRILADLKFKTAPGDNVQRWRDRNRFIKELAHEAGKSP